MQVDHEPVTGGRLIGCVATFLVAAALCRWVVLHALLSSVWTRSDLPPHWVSALLVVLAVSGFTLGAFAGGLLVVALLRVPLWAVVIAAALDCCCGFLSNWNRVTDATWWPIVLRSFSVVPAGLLGALVCRRLSRSTAAEPGSRLQSSRHRGRESKPH